MRKQGFGGDIVHIASKNGLVAGPNNIGYGTAKAAQQHMSRLLAAEVGKDKIRVNTIIPDGVIIGSKIWEGEWAEGRAKAHGITVDELPAFYAKRNLLQEIIRPADIANGVFALVAILDKSTGNMINVDGGCICPVILLKQKRFFEIEKFRNWKFRNSEIEKFRNSETRNSGNTKNQWVNNFLIFNFSISNFQFPISQFPISQFPISNF